MMLDYTFDLPNAASMIYDAISEVLDLGFRTEDIATRNTTIISTSGMRDIILEKIKDDGSLTDKSLSKSLAKDGYLISDDLFNKTLLDLEIMGLITVSWITKNTRRIEIITKQVDDEVEIENKKMLEKDYEASFPKANGTSD